MQVNDVGPELHEQPDDASGRFRIIHFVRLRFAMASDIDHATIMAQLQQAFPNADKVYLDSALRRRVRAQEEDSQIAMLASGSIIAFRRVTVSQPAADCCMTTDNPSPGRV